MLNIYAGSIKGLGNSYSTSVLTMSPLITILVIMLLTVVYNESQYITDFQDAYQTVLKKSVMPMELCASTSPRKLCEESFYRYRLKKNDVNDFEYEDPNDLLIDEIEKDIGQKRNDVETLNCAIKQNRVELGEGYFPKMLNNVSCMHTSAIFNGKQICLLNSYCQPVVTKATLLARRTPRDKVDITIPKELQARWKFEYIPIHVGCKCARLV